jgi:hypothetical protein
MILFVAKKEVGRAKFNKQEDRAVTGKGVVIVNNV